MPNISYNNNNNFDGKTTINGKITSIVNDSSVFRAHRKAMIESTPGVPKLDQITTIESDNLNITGSVKYKGLVNISPNSNINLNFNKIINIGDPISNNDAVHKKFLDLKVNLYNNIADSL